MWYYFVLESLGVTSTGHIPSASPNIKIKVTQPGGCNVQSSKFLAGYYPALQHLTCSVDRVVSSVRSSLKEAPLHEDEPYVPNLGSEVCKCLATRHGLSSLSRAFKNTSEKTEDLEDVRERGHNAPPTQVSNLTTVLVYRRKDSYCYQGLLFTN